MLVDAVSVADTPGHRTFRETEATFITVRAACDTDTASACAFVGTDTLAQSRVSL